MKMFLGGKWQECAGRIDVRNPFDGSVVDTVPHGTAADIDAAVATLVEGAATMRAMPEYERSVMLSRAAQLMLDHAEDLARTISGEEGKILAEARVEVRRAAEIIQLSAEEAKRLGGEVLPLDGAEGNTGQLGFTLRVPCGIVAAISPFNFPLHLVCHKVGPALAGGNAVLIKPATDTPLCALQLVELLLEAGAPPNAVACVTGPGAELGEAICEDRRIRKISFTGSYEVGDRICRMAGVKKVTMELGSNAPLIVMDDADMEKVVNATAITGYANAGQVCISAQRVMAVAPIYDTFVDRLSDRVGRISTGDQLDEKVNMGPMVRERDAERVCAWIDEAVAGGARLVVGGQREGANVSPAVVADVDPSARISCEELFGPAVAVTRVADIEEGITRANDTNYGLSAAIFTQDIDRALRFARQVDAGNIHINWGPQWRADLMPYGGLKDSGTGKEGPRYAVEEMTELKTVVVHTARA